MENLNKDSIISRLGADQFCILLKNRPFAEIHQIFAEFKENIKKEKIAIHNGDIQFSISVGASLDKKDSLEDMIAYADEALANATHKGGDMVVINS